MKSSTGNEGVGEVIRKTPNMVILTYQSRCRAQHRKSRRQHDNATKHQKIRFPHIPYPYLPGCRKLAHNFPCGTSYKWRCISPLSLWIV